MLQFSRCVLRWLASGSALLSLGTCSATLLWNFLRNLLRDLLICSGAFTMAEDL